MKRNSKIILSTLGMLAVIGMSTGAMAYDGAHKRGDRHSGANMEQRIDKMKEHLNLTDQQAREIKAVLEARKDLKQDRRSGRKEARRAMMKLDPSAPDYMKQVDRLAHQQAEAMVRKIKAHAETRKKIHAILTPEQREKARAMHEKRSERFKKHQHHDFRDRSSHEKNWG